MQTLEKTEPTVKTVKLTKAHFLLFRAMERVQERAKRMAEKLEAWKGEWKAKHPSDVVFTFKPAGESEQKVASIKEQPGKRAIDFDALERDFPAAYHACVESGKPMRVFRWH